MRDIKELSNRLAPRVVKGAEPVGKVGCIEALDTTRQHASPPIFQRAARVWAHRFDVEELFINLRPGLPCIMGWYAVQRSWPLTVVVSEKQLELAPSDIQAGLMELWHRANRRHIARDVVERDMLITHIVPLLGIADLMSGRVPIIEHDVVPSGPCEL